MATVIDTPEGIALYRLIALKGALKLEALGMKRRGQSALSIAKREYGCKGNRAKVLEQIEALCEEGKKQMNQ